MTARRPARNNKEQASMLGLGIAFIVLGIGLRAGDSSAWLTFIIVGIVFLIISGGSQAGKKRHNTGHSHPD